MSLHTKFDAVKDDLNSRMIDREEAINIALVALLTGEHFLMLGPPGTAKSMLIREICKRIIGAKYFEKLIHKYTVPEDIFGALKISELEKDNYIRKTENTVVDSHLVFLDEIYKATTILHTLLTLMNERIYQEEGKVQDVPLVSFFAASNELAENDSFNALHDRFLLRLFIPYLDEGGKRRLLKLKLSPKSKAPMATITLSELFKAQEEVASIPFSQSAEDALLGISRELESEGIAISDRRFGQLTKLVQAMAWLDGASEVTDEHCSILNNALWDRPEQIRTVERVICKVTNPLSLEAVELEDAARDLYGQKPAKGQSNLIQSLEPLLRQMGDIHTRLESRIASSPNKAKRAKTALENVAKWRKELGMMALQSINAIAQPNR